MDDDGVFKYILIDVDVDGHRKFVVRGYEDCEYHGACVVVMLAAARHHAVCLSCHCHRCHTNPGTSHAARRVPA